MHAGMSYTVDDHSPQDSNRFSRVPDAIRLYDGEDWEFLAEEMAEHYYRNCDGWEDEWPVEIGVWRGDALMGVYKIEMEMSPSFLSSGSCREEGTHDRENGACASL